VPGSCQKWRHDGPDIATVAGDQDPHLEPFCRAPSQDALHI
jgi:hypothetical protein